MIEFHPIPQFIENIFTSKTFFCCVWFFIIMLFCWLLKVLHHIFLSKANKIFEKIMPLDDAEKKKMSRLIFICSFLFPVMMICGLLWIGILRGKGYFTILGITFGYWVGFLHVVVVWICIACCIKLINIYYKTYCKSDCSNKRPIHAFVNILYVLLCTIGLFSIMSFVTKERPIVLMSTFGATFAIFVFAFKNFLSALTANIQLNVERIVKVGDMITLSSYNIDGIVETINARTIQVRNWDMSLASFPITMLMEETFLNYTAMHESKARQIKRALIVDQKTVRFLTQEEIRELKESHLLTDEMLKRAEAFDITSELAPCRLWTNLELFCLYTEDYLGRREDIRHDKFCMMRLLDPAEIGIPVQIYCYVTITPLVKFEERQRGILCHLLAVLPLFHLRISQFNNIRMDEEHIKSMIHQDVCSSK